MWADIDFLHADKHQSFPQGDTIIFDDMIKHFESTQSDKFAISLQQLKKEVRDGVHFLHPDKNESFNKLA